MSKLSQFFRKKRDDTAQMQHQDMKQHPLMRIRHLSSTQETLEFLPHFTKTNPRDKLKELVQQLGCPEELKATMKSVASAAEFGSSSTTTAQTTMERPKQHLHLNMEPANLSESVAKLSGTGGITVIPMAPPAITSAAKPERVVIENTPKIIVDTGGTTSIAAGPRKETMAWSPKTSEFALFGLEAHNFLSTDGYVSFRDESPFSELVSANLDTHKTSITATPANSGTQVADSELKRAMDAPGKPASVVPKSKLKNTLPIYQMSMEDIDPNMKSFSEAMGSQEDVNDTHIIRAIMSSRLTQGELQEVIQKAIAFHEEDNLVVAFQLYCIAAQNNLPIGLFLVGLALRHGWGCTADQKLALACLEYSSQCSSKVLRKIRAKSNAKRHDATNAPHRALFNVLTADDLEQNLEDSFIAEDKLSSSDKIQALVAKQELSMALYELGQCYKFGWGVSKSKATTVFYYRMAADLGDPEAQMDLAFCYEKGFGVKVDRFMAASYFRIAALQGKSEFGLAWVSKQKYDDFFKKNFPKYAALQAKKNNTVTDIEENSEVDKTATTHMNIIRRFLVKAKPKA